MKKIVLFIVSAVTAAAAVYLMRHLARWEWHRAMFAGMAMIAGELALVGVAVLHGVRREMRKPAARGQTHDQILYRLHETRPPSDRVFEWLRPRDNELYVFVLILLGGGALISVAAWIIDKLAKATSSAGLEHRLAAQLGRLRPPSDGLVVADDVLIAAGPDVDDDSIRLLLGPSHRP